MSKRAARAAIVNDERRWRALIVLCLGVLITSINTTSVNVALPSIGADLGFSEASLVWVVNAYFIAFGGFLLLGGRMGDLFGRRRLFMLGTASFALASCGCALATSSVLLVAARFCQGMSGAIVSALALSQIAVLFTEVSVRARAMGIYIFVSAGAGSLGVLLGGSVTTALSWRWVFAMNVPVAATVCALSAALLPPDDDRSPRSGVDVAGAVTVTAALMLAVYAIVEGNSAGWRSAQTLSLSGSALLLLIFVRIETRAQTPLIRLGLFRTHNLVVAIVVGVLVTSVLLAWNFVAALYLQRVLQLSPWQVSLAFLPASVGSALMSLVASPILVIRFGTRRPLVIGVLIAAAGLAWLARTPASASILFDVFPGMVLVGVGTGVAYNPLFLCALDSVASREAGATSGIVNTAFTIGGALGLAALAGIGTARTDHLLVAGAELPLALGSAYQTVFVASAAVAALAAVIAGAALRKRECMHAQPESAGSQP